MKVDTRVQNLKNKKLLTFERSRSKFKVKSVVLINLHMIIARPRF